MTPFQYLALTFLALLLTWELFWFARGWVRRGPWVVRCLVWIGAALAIAFPDLATDAANVLGIQRGADLVTYLFALAFLGVSFYFYSRVVKLQRQQTELVRQLALREARRGPSPH